MMRTRFEVIDPSWEQDVHGAYIALPVRSGEPVVGRVALSGQGPLQPTTLWRISPSGLEVLNETALPMPLGQKLDIEVAIGPQNLRLQGSVCRTHETFDRGPLIGIRFDPEDTRSTPKDTEKVRKRTRWTCHPLFFPTGSLVNPGRAFDDILFSVQDISRDGLMIATSLRNKFLLKGLQLRGTISLPMAEKFSFAGEIVSTRVHHQGRVATQLIGLKFIDMPKRKIGALGRYIIKFGSNKHHLPSPKRLKSEGYGTLDASEAVEWDYVRTEQEYQKVLKLRQIAYRSVEGWPIDADDHLISDPFDERARILVGRFRDAIVATLRICFHEQKDTFEEELYINFPKDFPPRDTLVEASRAAIHPEFRGTDMFMNLMRFAMLTGLQAKRRWFVQSTYDYLTPIYKKVGFKEVGEPWMHPQLVGRKMQMFMVDVHSMLHARYGNPFLYQSLVPQIESFLHSSAFDELTKREKVKLKLYKLCAPAFAAYTKVQHLRTLLRRRARRSKSG